MTTIELLQKTKAAWPALSAAPAEEKNRLLLAMADALEESTPAILAANAQDMADAEGHISAVMLDRLRLDEGRIRAMADGVRAAAAQPRPPCGREGVIAPGFSGTGGVSRGDSVPPGLLQKKRADAKHLLPFCVIPQPPAAAYPKGEGASAQAR